MYQPFLLTLNFDCVGKLGQIRSSQTSSKILTLGTELKNWPMDLLKYPLSKQKMQKNNSEGHFPTEHNGVTDY